MFPLKLLDDSVGETIRGLSKRKTSVLLGEYTPALMWRTFGCLYIERLDIDVYFTTPYAFEDDDTSRWKAGTYLFCKHGTDMQVHWVSSLSLRDAVEDFIDFIGEDRFIGVGAIGELGCVYLLNGENP